MTENLIDLRKAVVAEARTFVNKAQWKDKARDEFAMDCLGLIIVVAKRLGYASPSFDYREYSRFSDGQFLVEQFRKFMVEVNPRPFTHEKIGMVVTIEDAHNPHHVGFLSQKPRRLTLIHSSLQARCVVEDEFTGLWDERVTHGFIFKEWAEVT